MLTMKVGLMICLVVLLSSTTEAQRRRRRNTYQMPSFESMQNQATQRISQGSFQQPMMTQGSFQQPMTSQGSFQQPMTSQGSFQQPMTSQGSFQQPMTSQGSFQQPMNTQTTMRIAQPTQFQTQVRTQSQFVQPRLVTKDGRPVPETDPAASLENTCEVGTIQPIFQETEIFESYCRCPDGSYGFTCKEGIPNPCADNEQQYFPADSRLSNAYFVECGWNIPFLFKCPATLIWNQTAQTCDWDWANMEQPVAAAPAPVASSYSSYSSYSSAPVASAPLPAAAPMPVAPAAPSYNSYQAPAPAPAPLPARAPAPAPMPAPAPAPTFSYKIPVPESFRASAPLPAPAPFVPTVNSYKSNY